MSAPIVEDGFVVGVQAPKGGVLLEVRGCIVEDALGIDGVLRTRLLESLGVETDVIATDDTSALAIFAGGQRLHGVG